MTFNIYLRNNFLFVLLSSALECFFWAQRGFSSPSPLFIKHSCILRNSLKNATWVETGTYLGQTTKKLSKLGFLIYSLEPSSNLFTAAKKYFSNNEKVTILNGTSEEILPILLPKINGSVNFWLDGHYSAGVTFKGDQDTPILMELNCIYNNLCHFDKVCILVDDVRCFNPNIKEFSSYPSLDILVNWANKNNFDWHIEHDIFIAKN